MSRPLCGRRIVQSGACEHPRMKGKQRCEWHWLLDQPMHIQTSYADRRLAAWVAEMKEIRRYRVPADEWPSGTRWCSGCQSFIPLFYTSGSRCRACSSRAAHASRIEATYGISGEEYEALLKLQGGRCFICQREPGQLRLAVDHDHVTGQVRGLLCANNEHGCNRAVLGNLEGARGGGVAAARRVLLYLARPPYDRLRDDRGGLSWEQFLRDELQRVGDAKS